MNEQLFAKGRASARRYLAAWFSDEDYWTEAEPDSAEWFVALAAYALSLPLADERLDVAERCLQPFLDDDEGVETALYPDGYAVSFVEKTAWGGEFDVYLGGFLTALERDHLLWVRAVELDGPRAVWSFDRNPLDDLRLNRHGRSSYGPWGPDGSRAVTHIAPKRCAINLHGQGARGQNAAGSRVTAAVTHRLRPSKRHTHERLPSGIRRVSMDAALALQGECADDRLAASKALDGVRPEEADPPGIRGHARSRCSRFANEEYRGAHRRIGTISVS